MGFTRVRVETSFIWILKLRVYSNEFFSLDILVVAANLNWIANEIAIKFLRGH